MPLVSGTKLGPYEIQSLIGAGGMGEVYRARDTRLERSVAIKILPAQFSSDPVRKQRFEREAKTISSLNHPYICVLHDVGHQDGVDYLVMECVEGETLAKRLERGPLPVEQVLKFGAQIADALDKAHRSGVVHRDLKPGNIMLTPTGAKLLDFGLAKATVPLTSVATMTTAVTQDSPVTEQGTIVGTFQYMSPEQVEGKELDGRSDIFSLGAVLYEMVTGQRAFPGKSQLSVASAILEKEPAPISSVRPLTPPTLDHTIRKCLAKLADERWQSASDLKSELLWTAQSSEQTILERAADAKTRSGRMLLFAAGVALLVAASVITTYFFSPRGSSAPAVRSVIVLPPEITLVTLGDNGGAPTISPDGTNLVFVGVSDQKQMLFLRSSDSASAKPLPGTELGKFPFWSSNGKSIGFFADQQLKRLDLAGGPPMNVVTAPDGRGGTWAGDTILFAPFTYEAIYRVHASGGKPVPVTTLDRSQHTTHRWPRFLPDGRHFVYLAAHHSRTNEGNSALYVGSIDGGNAKLIVQTNASALYSMGNLLYSRDGSLIAQPFDMNRLELRGEATPIGQALRESGNWGMIASASDNGVVVFQSLGEVKYPVSWFDGSGRTLGPAPIVGQLVGLRLSPDGTRAAVADYLASPTTDVFVYDVKTGVKTRLTFGERTGAPVWSPDGNRVAYSARTANKADVYLKRADGAGERELLLSSGDIDTPTDWTRDGRYIVINRGEFGSRRMWLLPMFGDHKPFPLWPGATFEHFDGRVSPDGKWIAYASRESGFLEIYVTSFPRGAGKWQISLGGVSPTEAWSGNGKELYFVTSGNLMDASIQESEGSIMVKGVHPLFRSPFLSGLTSVVFDVDPKDGQRFIGSTAPDTITLPLNVITNWTEMLKKK